MSQKRVVITGLGVVAPNGLGKEEFWDAIKTGRSGIGSITKFDASNFPTRIAGEVKNFKITNYGISKKEEHRMDPAIQYATAAAVEAIKDANLTINQNNAEQIGVIMGNAVGGFSVIEEQHKVFLMHGPRHIRASSVPMMLPNMVAGQVAMHLGAKGPNIVIASGCASSTHSIGEAFRSIQREETAAVITGGSEAVITPLALAGFCATKAMSTNNESPTNASRPFDLKRDGFVLAEGGAVLILESLSHARERKAKIYAEIVGYGRSADAFHLTAPDPSCDQVTRAMRNALKDANLQPTQIDYINAHASSTPYNDKYETIAIKRVFNDYAYKIPISATKSTTGHTQGACGAIEAISVVLSIRYNFIPPTINYEFPDPECDLDYVPNIPRKKEINFALSNSFGFGGNNACIILKKFTE